jgi:hypothetical protein
MSKRPLSDPCWLPLSTVSGTTGPPSKAEALRAAYARHTAELLAIDEQQGKFLLVMLGIFSAAATLLASLSKVDHAFELPRPAQIGLTVITGALFLLWQWHTRERHDYRQAVRDLLVRCELALGFYLIDAYLANDTLYTRWEREFPSKGGFLVWVQLGTVAGVAVGFLFVLWSHRILSWWGG